MTSLPVPDSPWSRTVASVDATNVARLIASAQPAECPTIRSCDSWLDTATSRDLIDSTALMAYLLATSTKLFDRTLHVRSALRGPRDGAPRRHERLRSFDIAESSLEEW